MSRGRALAVAAAMYIALLSGCGGAGNPSGPGAATGATQPTSATKEVAIQLADLPAGFRECDYSGDIEEYLARVAGVDPSTHESMSTTWAKLRQAGATAGYAAHFGDSQRACDNFLLPVEQRNFGNEEEHIRNHPKIATSFVFRFRDTASAQAAYQADFFGQSGLREEIAMDVAVGEDTRLGPNAISAATQGAPVQIRQAIWQRSDWNVLFRSAAIDRQVSEAVTAAINLRMA